MISYIVLGIVGVLLIVADQLTKMAIHANIPVNQIGFDVIDNFFAIVHVHNTGGAWGILSTKTWLLVLVSLICAALILYIYICAKPVFLRLSLMLVFAGAIGNMIDRIFRHYVIDFISFYNIFGYEFPSFNVADICVTAGCIGLLIYVLFMSGKQEAFREGTFIEKVFKSEGVKKSGSSETENEEKSAEENDQNA